MSIDAVFFDMGGTIETYWFDDDLRLHATPGIQKQLIEADIDLGLDNEQLYGVVAEGLARYKEWKNRTLEELTPLQVWRDFIFSGYLINVNRLATIAEELMFCVDTRYYQREMRPEMPAVLEAIRQMGLKIGLISNICSRDQVPYNLEQYGILKYFDPIVLSCEYGRRKPDPAIFHYAARLASVPTRNCIYVGDSILHDIRGACRSGFRMSVQILNLDERCDECDDYEGIVPDAVITQMDELLSILKFEIHRNNRNGASPKIQAILFDAGDILYYRPNRGKKLSGFLQELGLSLTNASPMIKNELMEQANLGRMDQTSYREAKIRLYGVAEPEHIQRGVQILEEEDNDIQFFPGVQDTLIVLKERGDLLGIITDTAFPISVKLQWFERGGFGDVWDTIISSNELGVHKPDPLIYQAALRQLALSAEQAVFVGHKASELDGAKAAGMKTIAFNFEKDARADFYIHKFSDLLTLPINTSDHHKPAE